ncbi:PREDICTED: hyaluronan and proteoglycan link protein 3-like [Branchiostoma belcheri]|uniref:Hyaluronan and proteoglycan link protein 3-like n=1 Tax=Branchiostoma belcheri TaxID=7741 RepID=A0A6P4YLA6_BRABE|nr:PREDICTED: hyaluronan and proteoglycan link protein 3-like [Branchiostoma belcheri]
MLFSIANLCLVLSLLQSGCSADQNSLSTCEIGAMLQNAIADIPKPYEDRLLALEEQLAQERTIRAELEGRVNSLQETLMHVQSTNTQQSDLAAKLKADFCNDRKEALKLGGVFQVRSPVGHYEYTLQQASQACADQGATLASYSQLYTAWQDGMENCACGWLSDGSARYPRQSRDTMCGGGVGIMRCARSKNNAWCYKNNVEAWWFPQNSICD